MFIIIISLALLAFALLASTALRLRYILNRQRPKTVRHGRRNPNQPTHLLIVLGSGGHTAEMIAMLERAITPLNSSSDRPLAWQDYTHRTWVVSEGDSLSASRAKTFEDLAEQKQSSDTTLSFTSSTTQLEDKLGSGTYDIVTVPRARKIHQPLFTAPISCLSCMRACWTVLTSPKTAPRSLHTGRKTSRDFPDLILCNGPATATILILTSVILRFFNIKGCNTRNKMRTVYIESWARVQKLSLSGRVLSFVVDRFVVQWPQLAEKVGKRVEYLGVLV